MTWARRRARERPSLRRRPSGVTAATRALAPAARHRVVRAVAALWRAERLEWRAVHAECEAGSAAEGQAAELRARAARLRANGARTLEEIERPAAPTGPGA